MFELTISAVLSNKLRKIAVSGSRLSIPRVAWDLHIFLLNADPVTKRILQSYQAYSDKNSPMFQSTREYETNLSLQYIYAESYKLNLGSYLDNDDTGPEGNNNTALLYDTQRFQIKDGRDECENIFKSRLKKRARNGDHDFEYRFDTRVKYQSGFSSLSDEALDVFFEYIDLQSLRNLSCCSFTIHRMCLNANAALNLKLYEHQKRALRWMQEQESRRTVQHIHILQGHEDFAFNDDNRLKKRLKTLEQLCKYPQWFMIPMSMIDDDRDQDELELHKHDLNETKHDWGHKTSESRENENLEEGKFIWVNIETAGVFCSHNENAPPGSENTQIPNTHGGLLCDEPGLGKTITILSLIFNTYGQTYRAPITSSSKDAHDFTEGNWLAKATLVRKKEIMELCSITEKAAMANENGLFARVTAKQRKYLRNNIGLLFDTFKQRAQLESIYDELGFKQLRDQILYDIDTAMTTWKETDHIYSTEIGRIHLKLISHWQATCSAYARDFLGMNGRKCQTRIEKRDNIDKDKPSVHSASTLIIVPGVLLNHWVHQVKQHVKAQYIPGGFEKGVYFDQNTQSDLPGVEVLAQTVLVIITKERLTREYLKVGGGGYRSPLTAVAWRL